MILFGGILFWFLRPGNHNRGPIYTTETVSPGNLVVKVSATGTLEPTNQVDVGSELSGLVEAVLAQENDHVENGQVLARLDVSKLTDEITKSEATPASAEAKVLQTTATSKEATAKLEHLRTVFRLSGGKVPSTTELETAEATLARAVADVASARAAVSEARAVLKSNQTNLSKASIRSPINGVVLKRKIEQAVRLPREFRFEGKEVAIRKEGDAVILEPVAKRKWPTGYWQRIDRCGKDLDVGRIVPIGGGLLHLLRHTPIGECDLLIASITLAHDLTLVTHNAQEFSRMPRLRVED